MSFVATAAVTSLLVVACSSDTTNGTTSPLDAGGGSPVDTGTSGNVTTNPTTDGGTDSGATVVIDPAVTTAAAAVITINASVPYVAKSIHTAAGTVIDAKWGNHGGPVVTTPDATATNPQKLTRWTVPTGDQSVATAAALTSVNPTNLPGDEYFWQGDGFVDLPFGNVAIQSYTTTGDQSNGEAFLYSANYDTVVTRAFVNGFYSGRGITDGTKTRVVYAGLSGLTTTAADTDDNGLWASDITASSLTGATSVKLFGWDGFSGPVATDPDGDVFVAADVTGGAHSDAIYAVSRTQALGSVAVTQATILEADTQGTDSLAIAEVKGSGKGWVFAKAYDGATPASVYGHAFTVANGTVAGSGDVIIDAIKPVGTSSLSIFSAPDGNLWVAVKGDSTSWFIELTPKPN